MYSATSTLNSHGAPVSRIIFTTKPIIYVKFEVLTAVTIKNAVFWDATPFGSYIDRRFEGTLVLTIVTLRNIPEDCIPQTNYLY
jgi:hypothetical protein